MVCCWCRKELEFQRGVPARTHPLTKPVMHLTPTSQLNHPHPAGLLCFMVYSQWQLTVVTFLSVPLVTVVSRVYGSYYRTIAESVQDQQVLALPHFLLCKRMREKICPLETGVSPCPF